MTDEMKNASDHMVAELENTEPVPAPAPPKKIKKGFFARLRRESKRDRQLAALSNGYQQLIGLMSSIQMNMEVQAKNQQQLLGALENLPEVADGLKKMGTAAERQTEVIKLMRDQLNSNVHRDKQMSKSVSRINKTLVFTNILFVAGIAIAVYVFMTHSEKPPRPAQTQDAPPAVKEPINTIPDNEPATLAAPTNELESCASESISNAVVACETTADTNVVEACTSIADVCTNVVDVSTNIPEAGTNSGNTFTLIVNTGTNQPASD